MSAKYGGTHLGSIHLGMRLIKEWCGSRFTFLWGLGDPGNLNPKTLKPENPKTLTH